MNALHSDVAIIGGGLSGLTLAYRLESIGRSVRLFEGRTRLGGRIHTLYPPDGPSLEMGATWLGRKHTALWDLLEELNVEVFEQRHERIALFQPGARSAVQGIHLPAGEPPSYRIRGGSDTLIQALNLRLRETDVRTGCAVTGLRRGVDGVEILTDKGLFTATTVVSTLPPDLLVRGVDLAPALPRELTDLARQTDTWMGRSIKVALTYNHPFWRENGRSGTFFSNAGPVTEMYDHSNAADDVYALKAFADPRLSELSPDRRRQRVVEQLVGVYGPAAGRYTDYRETPWAAEPFTTHPAAADLLPHQNQGHALFRRPFWDGHLWLAGTETATAFPGYMEGAVRSAEWTAARLRQ
ncbi:monoamine oxidase [Lewinella marina]|uniref:Amine oxidase domain-containing protein n=1 Tax=Neolewinella marina TaxID=438751 RepID=A0A2G0CJH7_9BACT|nr:NAD(P)/FAD-dependent oxidoreductase [Neolewinella marina]NJB84716.1 monoamine oxidase [Neolewinella marina]PHL00122.1 hypothetical protein CGL56_03510 [Neolewinella marina]